MRRTRYLLLLALAAPLLRAAETGLERVFRSPPDAAKPQVWWHWMNGHASRAGITRDLEAMRAVGLGGVTLFEESDRIPPGPLRYASPEHFGLIAFAAEECQRLGLEFAFHNCPGWSSSGGPWIGPEQAMKHLTWSETAVQGAGRRTLSLPRPTTEVNPHHLPPHRYEHHDYYRDIAVIAFRTPAQPEARLEDWMSKAFFLVRYDLREQTAAFPPAGAIDGDSIRVLPATGTDGAFEWDGAPGDWTILRIGYTLTGNLNQQGPTNGGRGLDCDKLDRAALDHHWEHFVGKVISAARGSGSRALTTVLIDSYETETQTWTPGLPAEFRRRRGYDLAPWFPCLTGRVVDSLERTERFLWDFRRTIAELITDNYYGHFAARCRAVGLKAAFEGYGYNGIFDDFEVSRLADIPLGEFWAGIFKYSHWGPKIAASAADLSGRHIVGAEAFTAGGDSAAWSWHPYALKAQGDHYLARGITRIHIQASAHQPWDDAVRPGMTMGPHGIQMNRHNTWWPQSRAWLSYLTRTQAMLQQGQLAADVLYYYGENSPATLRLRPAGSKDRLGLDWDPDADMSPDAWLQFPPGHDFHVANARVLAELSVDARGRITHPQGARYEVLALPNETRMSLPVLRRIAALVEAGATVLGPKPLRSPGLEGFTDADRELRTLADRVWGGVDGTQVKSHAFGRGRVWFGVTLADVLRERSVGRDFAWESRDPQASPAPRLDYQHRRTAEADFYFVSNQRNAPASVRLFLREAGRVPELWHPETGKIAVPLWRPTADGRTAIELDLAPAESCFVVFPTRPAARAPAFASLARDGRPVVDLTLARVAARRDGADLLVYSGGTYAVAGARPLAPVAALRPPLALADGWRAEFPVRGGPVRVEFASLASWTDQPADAVRFFSGTAVYTRDVTLDAAALAPGTVVELDLGTVREIAEVKVNGRDFGVLWKPPFRADITAALRPGANRVEVRVTNLWRNRLIGDARIVGYTKAESRKLPALQPFPPVPAWVTAGKPHPNPQVTTFTTNRFLAAEDPLVESGLLGPVRLVWGQRIPLQPLASP